MDVEARTKAMPVAALGVAALGGLVGIGLAWGGRLLPGLTVWTACAVGGVAALWWARSAPLARTLPQLVAQIEGDADHPQAGLMREVRGLIGRVEAHGLSVREVVRQVQEHATLIAWVIDTLNRAVANARDSLASMQAAMERVGEHAGEVLVASQKGVANLDSMGSSTEELFEGAETLNRSVEEATASVMQINGALSAVLQGVSLLSEASDRTTEFVAQVGKAMGDIRGRIDQNLSLAQKVEESARRGREVVERVGRGVRAIRSTSEEMVNSIHALGQQSHEIEGVIGIITDVAEETSLLSLNAAILAAQAGDQGAAFGVVAEQIRSLARRTRDSTKHVEELIRGIQSNITQANLGLAANLEAVEEGEEMGREATRQLELIAGAVDESVGQSREIVRAAQETDEKSATMVNAAGEVNESLHRVAETLTESLREMDRVQHLIQSLAALSQSVRAATARHREVGRSTADLIGSFTHEVEGIQGLLTGQDRTASELGTALGEVHESSDSTRESLDALHALLKELVLQADGIREEVGIMWEGGELEGKGETHGNG
jgi:methyl-accepting chemotaxis protein